MHGLRFILLVGLSAVLSAPSSAQEGAGNPRWSYLYGQQEVSLELDGARAAVLLADGARDEREALSALLADGPGFLPLAAGDAQGYPHLWFPRFVPGLSEDERLTAIDRLHGAPGVELASVVLRYRKALLVPRPELLVILEEGGSSTLEILLAEEDLGWIGELPGLRPTYHLSADGPPTTVLERCRELLRVPGVAVAEPNFILHLEPLTVPSDPLFPDQWHLDNSGQSGGIPGADISAPAAWDITTGSSSVVIAVLDEGLDMSHPDLAPNIWGGHESTDQPSPGGLPGNADPLDGHGTSCAGIAAAIGNNGIGVSGVSWSAAILAVRIGYAAHWTEIAWEVDGITWAVDNGADVLSNSWGGGSPSALVQGAIQYAKATGRGGLGSVVLFAAGNTGLDVEYPARFPESIAVGATSPCDERKTPTTCDGENWWASNFGPELDVVAPGVLMQTTDNVGAGGYGSGDYISFFNGTSSACPVAAGAAALLLSIAPGLTADEVQTFLELSADDQVGPPAEDTAGWDPFMGWGRINVAELLALGGAPAAPTGLACTPLAADVLLTWTNGETYDNVRVARDGVEIALLTGSATSHLDSGVPAGVHSYEVRGVSGGVNSPPATCSAFVDLGATELIYSPAAGAIDGAAGLAAALSLNGLLSVEAGSLAEVPDLNVFERIWVNLGIFPDNHVLGAAEAALLEAYITDGAGGSKLYMEGGDTWFLDPPTPLHALFQINATSDGAGNLFTALGTGAIGCDLTGLDLGYAGENAFIDHIGPAAGATAIQVNSAPFYGVAVFLDGAGYRTIGASHELAGYSDGANTRGELVAAYLDCLAGFVPPVTSLACVESGGGALLTWANAAGYDSVEVTRNGSLIAVLPGDAASHSDPVLPVGDHLYAVTPFIGGQGAAAATCTVTILPPAVAGLSCNLGQNGSELSWTNPYAYSSIRIDRNGAPLITLPGAATSFTDLVPPEGSHSYDVVGIAGALEAPPATCGLTVTAPLPVGALTCDGSSGDVLLGWVNNGPYDEIRVRDNGLLLAILPGGATSYLDPSADIGSHNYEVTAIAGWLSSEPVPCAVVVAPASIVGLTCAQEIDGVLLSWANGALYDTIEIRRDGILVAVIPGAGTSFTDNPGEGSWSYTLTGVTNGIPATPADCAAGVLPPPPVSGLACDSAAGAVQLSWTNGGLYTGLEVRRDGGLIAVIAGTDSGYLDPSPAIGAHVYELRALLGSLVSPDVPCSVTVLPLPVSGLACDLQGSTASLTWTNGALYDFIDVLRDGVLLASVPGGSIGYTDPGLADGTYLYQVIPSAGGLQAPAAGCTLLVDLPLMILGGEAATGFPGQSGAPHFTFATSEIDLEGFSYGLDFDGSALTITALTLDGTLTGSIGAEFFAPHLDNDPAGGWYTVGIVMDLSPPITTVLPAGADQPIVQALFDVDPGAPTATVLPMEFRSDLGDPAVGAVFVAQGGTSFTPTLVDGSFEIIQGAVFLRGDMDGSGMIDIADPIGILGYLFNNGQASCLDAADANDSGAVDVADPIYALDFLFNNGAPLPPPFPDPGIDPTDDPLDCGSYP